MMILCGRRAKLLQGPDWPAGRGHWLPTRRAPENSLRWPDFSWSESDLAPPETHTAHRTWTHTRFTRERKLCVCVCVCDTFLKRSSISGFLSHSSVMRTTAPCNTPTDQHRYELPNICSWWRKIRKLTGKHMTWAAGASCRRLYAPWFFSARRARAAGANSSPRSWTFLTMWTAHRAAWKNGGGRGGDLLNQYYTIRIQNTISMITKYLHLLYVANEIEEEKEELTFFFM